MAVQRILGARTRATAFAPATVANVAVGFDLLGFAFPAVGDRVTVELEREGGSALEILVSPAEGIDAPIPTDPAENTAGVALRAMFEELGVRGRVRIRLRKGIPVASGMGGSAASAVGAVVAANALLSRPLDRKRLLPWALAGEAAASGAPHADNAAPCLFGGLTAIVEPSAPRVIELPAPPGIWCALVHPHLRIDTRSARAALADQLPLRRHVAQSMHLAGFIAGCYRGDAGLVTESMMDLVAGPQRERLIPGLEAARTAARSAGALAFAISGSGPSVFAWTTGEHAALDVVRAVRRAFEPHVGTCDGWSAALGAPGAAVLDEAD